MIQNELIILYPIVFMFGIVVGSFLNVLIFRIPKGEGFVKGSSHCMSCDKRLAWYELIPLFSWLALRGRCSKCKTKISVQYPIVEATNGALWMLVLYIFGLSPDTVLGCLLASTLLVLSVIDARTTEIPLGTTIFIGILGVIRAALNFDNITSHLFGFGIITAFLFLVLFVSGGNAIGGGDVKLMAGCGLFLGLYETIFAFVVACVVGSVVHVIRMRFFGASRVLAMGPYLAVGVFISFLFGNTIIEWYMMLLGV